jgi:hypothetical protein
MARMPANAKIIKKLLPKELKNPKKTFFKITSSVIKLKVFERFFSRFFFSVKISSTKKQS